MSAPFDLILPEALEPRRARVVADVLAAERVIEEFAAAHGWAEEGRAHRFDRVEVALDQAAYGRRLLEVVARPADTPMPTPTAVAALERRVLIAVAPEEYARVVSEYATGEDASMRLLAHEVAHRLHVAILGGDEQAMGPAWFYEGFAVVAAGQPLGRDLRPTSAAEALALARATGPGAAARFAATRRYLAARVPLPELVRWAGAPDFEDACAAADTRATFPPCLAPPPGGSRP